MTGAGIGLILAGIAIAIGSGGRARFVDVGLVAAGAVLLVAHRLLDATIAGGMVP